MLNGLRSNLFEFIQESISSEVVEFEGVKEMVNWVSST